MAHSSHAWCQFGGGVESVCIALKMGVHGVVQQQTPSWTHQQSDVRCWSKNIRQVESPWGGGAVWCLCNECVNLYVILQQALG